MKTKAVPEPVVEPARGVGLPSAAAMAAMRRVALGLIWRCGACGYQRSSIARPALCPGCKADGESFRGMSAVQWRQAELDVASDPA